MLELNLKERNAIVCGSTQGIGRAVAQELARLGATVVLIARDEAALKTVQESLATKHNQRHYYICADFDNPDGLKTAIHTFLQNFSPVHILVNNSGGPPAGDAIDAEPGAFEDAFSRHLICNQILTRAVVPGMKAEKYGRIINIISTSVKQPIKGLGVSNTIRGAVASWAKTISAELASFGITVNNVLPGFTKTGRLYSLMETIAQKSNKSVSEVEREMIAQTPAGRLGEPEEIAYAVAFLASSAASYINGISLAVDGGKIGCL